MTEAKIKLLGYVPGAIGRVTVMHGKYYSKHWDFDIYFESKGATELSDFLRRLEEGRDKFWSAVIDDEIVGSITIDGIKAETDGAHLRWFIMDPSWQGHGIGNLLMKSAVDFCAHAGYRCVYLWTFSGLDPARHLYEKYGFRLVEERSGTQWGKKVTEQRFELNRS